MVRGSGVVCDPFHIFHNLICIGLVESWILKWSGQTGEMGSPYLNEVLCVGDVPQYEFLILMQSAGRLLLLFSYKVQGELLQVLHACTHWFAGTLACTDELATGTSETHCMEFRLTKFVYLSQTRTMMPAPPHYLRINFREGDRFPL